jgi:hypothetical protein
VPRPLSPEVLEQLNSPELKPVIFCEGLYRSGYLRLWTGLGEIPWNGHIWMGLGIMVSISSIRESVDIRADGITLTLSGIPNEMLSLGLNEAVQGNPVRIWFGVLDEQDNVIADPYMAFAGRMDVPTITEEATTASISLSVENRLIDLQRTRERRYTDNDQQIDYPGDRGLEYVPNVQEWNGIWGKAGGNNGGGGQVPKVSVGPPPYKPRRGDA